MRILKMVLTNSTIWKPDLDGDGFPDVEYTAEEVMEMVPRNSRAKRLEEHYGKTLDIGFRYSF